MRPVKTSFLPFRPSRLSIPPSPCSPRLPLTPSLKGPSSVSFESVTGSSTFGSPNKESTIPIPPPTPQPWKWQCHICHHQYQLGVTRRCLEDGHYFCSGSTAVRGSRRSKGRRYKKHRPCQSEFDYIGWRNWGEWRRSVRRGPTSDVNLDFAFTSAVSPMEGRSNDGILSHHRSVPSPTLASPKAKRRNCGEICDFPSECRWGKNHALQSPATTSPVSPPTSVSPPTTFEEILNENGGARGSSGDLVHRPRTPIRGKKREHQGEPAPAPGSPNHKFWASLLASAHQRRAAAREAREASAAGSPMAPSPLALHPVLEEDLESAGRTDAEDFEVPVVMVTQSFDFGFDEREEVSP